MKPKSFLRLFFLACGSLLVGSIAHAAPYTWTQNTVGLQSWVDGANWDGSGQFVSGSGNELIFFADTTTALPIGTQTIGSIPSALSMNTLTLNGKGPNNILGTAVIIGDNTSTWTIGDGATGTITLNSAFGGGSTSLDGRTIADRYVNYTIGANLTLAQTTTFTGNGGGIQGMVFSGNITDGGSAFGIIKSGSSILALSGTNTYTGTTMVTGGALRLSSAGALSGGIGVTGGTSALTLNGAMLELASGDFQRNLGTGSDQFRITGGNSGFSALGGSRVVTVNNDASTELVWGSADFSLSKLVFNTSSSDSGITLTNNIDLNGSTRAIQVTTNSAILSGVIQNSGGTAGITKDGVGRLVLSGTNTYNGATTLSDGVVSVGATENLGAASADLVFNGGTLQITGTSLTSFAGIGHTVSITNNKTVGLDIDSAANTFTVNQALTMGSGGLVKGGGGTLVLSQDNTYTGATTATGGGTLVLDYSTNNGSKLANSAALNLSGSNLVLRGGSHAEAIGSIVLAANTGNAISRDGSSTTTIANAGALTTATNSNLTIAEAGIVSTTTANHASGIQTLGRVTVGSHFAAKDGSNQLQAYSGYVNYTAAAGGGDVNTVNQLTGGGTMAATLTSYSLRIKNGGNSDVLDLGTNKLLNVANGGTVLYAGGFDNNYTINGTGTAAVRAASGNQPLNMNIFSGTLTVNALLTSSNQGNTLIKSGAGTLVVGGGNSYSGATYIQQGVLRLSNASGLGTTASGTIVQSGAALELSNNISVGAEALTLSGTGITNQGALRSLAATTNSFSGEITMGGGGARINSDSGSDLTLTGGIATAAVQDVTFGGAGNTTVSTTGIRGAGSLVKDGVGRLTLNTTNIYDGTTTVSGGILAVNGSIGSLFGTTVQSGATLKGSGLIISSVTIQSGGTLASGNSIESLATGALSLKSLATFAYEINNDAAAAAAGDLTAVTGDLTLDLANSAILTLTELGAGSWTDGEKLTLISYSGLWNGGLFELDGNVLADDSTFNFSGKDWVLNYNDTLAGANFTSDLTGTSFVTMTAGVIPEPSAVLLGSLGVLLLLRRRRN